MKCYRRIGWSSLVRPQDRRSTTMSDGAVFSSIEKLAELTERDGFHVHQVKEIELPDDDPQIDFYLCNSEEQDRRLNEYARRLEAKRVKV